MEFGFERLTVWKKSRELSYLIYRQIKKFPIEERYGLCDQMRRAVISISSNIAEGSGRMSMKEKIHFCHVAYGSLMEILSQLILASDLEYINQEEYKFLREKAEEVERLMRGYHNFLRTTKDKNDVQKPGDTPRLLT